MLHCIADSHHDTQLKRSSLVVFKHVNYCIGFRDRCAIVLLLATTNKIAVNSLPIEIELLQYSQFLALVVLMRALRVTDIELFVSMHDLIEQVVYCIVVKELLEQFHVVSGTARKPYV